MPLYIKALATKVWNLQKGKINIVLDMATYQTNAKASQLIEFNNLLEMFKKKFNNDN